jgi:capping protein (actin filament) muscle Z-line, alpha
MTGSVRINSHFWENGNVQFNLIKNFDETALAASDGVSIVAAIEKLETRY